MTYVGQHCVERGQRIFDLLGIAEGFEHLTGRILKTDEFERVVVEVVIQRSSQVDDLGGRAL
ncbi:hypothetical protein [Nocardia vaccinii]|uniref:hypothetical protein n=1 Tax=Nocardia vaccinii TaxID=1822 RepID=UPI0012F4E975|nr:hypothetical protein [Nocardia vaccinii]